MLQAKTNMARRTEYRTTIFLLCISFSIASSFQIRLRGGYSNIMGRVEVNLDDGYGWGTVCDDSWDSNDAKVACRSLGLPESYATPVSNARFGEGTGYIHMDDVGCSGTESSLGSCSYYNRTRENCNHPEDAGVVCWISSFTHTYHAFIYNSDPRVINPLNGILMLNYTNEKYAVGICSDNFTTEEARVACSELGYERNLSHVLSKDTYGKTSDVFLYLLFTCSGSESSLSRCGKKLLYGMCPQSHSFNPSIVCNYQAVSSINLFGNQVSLQRILLDNNVSYKIICETGLGRPQPIVTWVLDDKTMDFGVKNFTFVSGSLYRVKSTLTIYANNSLHGKSITCCSRDPVGHKICSLTHTLIINVYPTIKTMELFHTKRNVENKTGDIFTCISHRSRPEPTIHWYHNGIQIVDPEMLSTKSLNSADGTFNTTSIITFPFKERMTGSNIIECKVSVEKYVNLISVPYFIRNDDYTAGKFESQSGGDSGDNSITGYVISYICFGGVIVILSVVVLCLSREIRNRGLNNSGNADVAATSSSCDDMARENRAYDGSDLGYQLENYEQLSPPPRTQNLGKREDTVYENARI